MKRNLAILPPKPRLGEPIVTISYRSAAETGPYFACTIPLLELYLLNLHSAPPYSHIAQPLRYLRTRIKSTEKKKKSFF